MKSRKQSKNFIGQLGNQGFSLIELLVSIVILILIMVPLMHNFFGSAKVNNTAKKLQDYSNMAANVVEDLKSMNLEQMLASPDYKQYPGPGPLGDVNYFTLKRTTESGEDCDVMVTIKTSDYKYPTVGTEHGGILMNNYKMPNISTIDDKINGMFFSNMYLDTTTNTLSSYFLAATYKNLDQVALDYFVQEARKYADQQFKNSSTYKTYQQALDNWQTKYQEASMNGTVKPTPPIEPKPDYNTTGYCNADEIKKWIKKSMMIQVSDTSNPVISYEITFDCDWSKSIVSGLNSVIDNKLTYNIGDRTYASLIKNIYFYYQTSIFQTSDINHPDFIIIKNNYSDGTDINLYIVKQSADATNPSIILQRNPTPPPVNVYTNLSDGQVKDSVTGGNVDTTKEIVTEGETKTRISSINVQIFKFQSEPSSKYQSADLLYSLDSNREE